MIGKFINKNIIHILSVMFIAFLLTDRILVEFDKKPVFTLFGNSFKDGGTTCKIGLGYSVILWKRIASKEENGNIIYGHKIGKEFAYFPMCYLKFYGYTLKPKKELLFVSGNETVYNGSWIDNLLDSILVKIYKIPDILIFPFFIFWFLMPIKYTIIIIMFSIFYIKLLIKTLAKSRQQIAKLR